MLRKTCPSIRHTAGQSKPPLHAAKRTTNAHSTYFGLDSFEASADGAMRVTADNVSAAFACSSDEFCIPDKIQHPSTDQDACTTKHGSPATLVRPTDTTLPDELLAITARRKVANTDTDPFTLEHPPCRSTAPSRTTAQLHIRWCGKDVPAD